MPVTYLVSPRNPIFLTILALTLGLVIYYWFEVPLPRETAVLTTHIIVQSLAIALILFGLIPFYKPRYAGLGIEEHYGRILVVTTYPLLIQTGLSLAGWTSLVLNIVLGLVFVALLISNLILLVLHLRDKDKSPPAYFAADLYLKENSQH